METKANCGVREGCSAVKKRLFIFFYDLATCCLRIVILCWRNPRLLTTIKNNKTYETYVHVYIYFIQTVSSHPGPGWLSAATEQRSHKASGPAQTGTVAPPDTNMYVYGCNILLIPVETLIYSMCTHTSHLHAQQGTDTGFRGITDGLKVMTPLQSQDHPTPSQWHQLTG